MGAFNEAVTGTWLAGSLVEKRCCNGDCSYETFYIPREYEAESWETPKNGKYFSFCKTAFRPCDLAVTVFLIIAKHHMKDSFTIRSDGEDVHWFDARLLCQMELGYGQDFLLNEEVKQ